MKMKYRRNNMIQKALFAALACGVLTACVSITAQATMPSNNGFEEENSNLVEEEKPNTFPPLNRQSANENASPDTRPGYIDGIHINVINAAKTVKKSVGEYLNNAIDFRSRLAGGAGNTRKTEPLVLSSGANVIQNGKQTGMTAMLGVPSQEQIQQAESFAKQQSVDLLGVINVKTPGSGETIIDLYSPNLSGGSPDSGVPQGGGPVDARGAHLSLNPSGGLWGQSNLSAERPGGAISAGRPSGDIFAGDPSGSLPAWARTGVAGTPGEVTAGNDPSGRLPAGARTGGAGTPGQGSAVSAGQITADRGTVTAGEVTAGPGSAVSAGQITADQGTITAGDVTASQKLGAGEITAGSNRSNPSGNVKPLPSGRGSNTALVGANGLSLNTGIVGRLLGGNPPPVQGVQSDPALNAQYESDPQIHVYRMSVAGFQELKVEQRMQHLMVTMPDPSGTICIYQENLMGENFINKVSTTPITEKNYEMLAD